MSGGSRPLLGDLLEVHDAAVGEAVQEDRDFGRDGLLGLLLKIDFQINFARGQMIGLPDLAHEHELRRDDHGQAGVLLVLKTQEVADLLISILESIITHLGRINWKHGMWEIELIQ